MSSEAEGAGEGGAEAGPDAVARLRRDFREGLGERLERMRAALRVLEGGFSRDAAERLYHAAHSLHGTAAAFGAGELGERAESLAGLARSWLRSEAVDGAQLEEARRRLGELSRAAEEARGGEGEREMDRGEDGDR